MRIVIAADPVPFAALLQPEQEGEVVGGKRSAPTALRWKLSPSATTRHGLTASITFCSRWSVVRVS